METLIEQARQLGELAADLEPVRKYREVQEAAGADAEATQLIQDFQQLAGQLSQQQQQGQQPSAEDVQTLQALQSKLSANATLREVLRWQVEAANVRRQLVSALDAAMGLPPTG